jgi:peptidylprolyl isomerase
MSTDIHTGGQARPLWSEIRDGAQCLVDIGHPLPGRIMSWRRDSRSVRVRRDTAGDPAGTEDVGCGFTADPHPVCSVTAVTHLPVSALALAGCAAALAVMLPACSSTTDTSSASPGSSTAPATQAAPAGPCPSTPPERGGTPDWTLDGATGSVAVTGPTETASPLVVVDGPFTVTETQVHTLAAGDGPVVADTASVSVCYMGVNGRNGNIFDSSYQRGAPAGFPLDGVVPGFQKAIAGQKVGSTVAVAMTSTDGYPDGQPRAGIEPGDTLIFAIKILDASN